jgi:flagellar M-ring protein FliF
MEIVGRFRSLTPARQVWLIAAAAGAVAVMLAAIWFLWLRTEYVPLFSNLSPADAATIVGELDRRKVAYRLAEGGASILVAEEQADGARLNVLTGDLPLKGAVGFELFNKSDMGLSDFSQRINYQRALQGELARTIMTLDGVDSARVHLSLGEDRIFRDDRIPPKASVTVRMKGRDRISPKAAQGIQRMVAAAVPKLEAGNVVVLDIEGRIVTAPAGPVPSPTPDAGSPSTAKLVAIEQYYAARSREALQQNAAAADIDVTVQASIAQPTGNDAQLSASLASWTPTSRDFPLRVTLSASMPLDEATQASLRSIVVAGLGTSLPQDAVGFTHRTPLPAASSAPAAQYTAIAADHSPVRPMAMPEPDTGWLQASISLLVLIAMLGGFFMVVRQVRNGRPLSASQHSDFAARLRAALSAGGDDALGR